MRARFRSWWRQIQQHPVVAIGLIVALVVVIALISLEIRLYGTGFNGYNKVTIAHIISGTNAGTVTRTEEYQPGKALWDWLQLLIIPLVLAVAALLFNFANSRTEREITAQRHAQDQQFAKDRYEQDQQIALDKQRQDLLQVYLDRMSELLLKEKLRSSEDDAEVRNVARVRTITVLTQLDARRIGYVFAFLREAGLMSRTSDSNVVSLSEADLHTVNWSQANLSDANLSDANLTGANLIKADLSLANLSDALLIKADLSLANLTGANLAGANLAEANLSDATLQIADLSGAHLSGAHLSGAHLEDANLSDAYLHEANLSGTGLGEAHLRKANLRKADLSGANLRKADLSGADLSEANLKGAIGVTVEEMEKQAKSLTGATMPDGTKHD
jgi:uncharacterized protein YjbI with pentapeptide repeats